MEFIRGMYGPDFNKADLVSFDFGDVNLLMRLPEHSEENGEKLLAQTNLTCIADDKWEVDADGTKTYTLTEHLWIYKYFHKQLNVERDVFLTNLNLLLKVVPDNVHSLGGPLSKSSFADWILSTMHETALDMNRQSNIEMSLDEAVKEWQVPGKVEDLGIIERAPLNWVVATFGHVDLGPPVPYIFVPINKQYFLIIIIESSKLYYSNINDAFTEGDIEFVKGKIIEEFLEHVQVEYSSEILEEIRRLN